MLVVGCCRYCCVVLAVLSAVVNLALLFVDVCWCLCCSYSMLLAVNVDVRCLLLFVVVVIVNCVLLIVDCCGCIRLYALLFAV